MLVIRIGNYAQGGIGEVVDLLAAVHYISRNMFIWDPPQLVKHSFHVVCNNQFFPGGVLHPAWFNGIQP